MSNSVNPGIRVAFDDLAQMRKPGTVIYLAGPMTGYPNFNYDRFAEVAAFLRENGVTVLNPAERYGGDTSLRRSVYLRAAVHDLLSVDGALFIDGWRGSAGACLEHQVCRSLGIPTYYASSGDE